MKELKIEHIGGYRQVSKYLTFKHNANFALIIDAMIYIYNQNENNLVEIGGKSAVKISNDYLSRHTGLGIAAIKGNLKTIENIGLITTVTKGQGNTRHYVILIDNINKYIELLEPEFDKWTQRSLERSKKDKERSVEADKNKLKTSQDIFAKNLKGLMGNTETSEIGLVEKKPTLSSKTNHTKNIKPTVVKTTKETYIETTTNKKNVVVYEIFNKEDKNGMYKKIEAYAKDVYKMDYEDYIAKLTKEDLERKFKEFKQQELEDSLIIEDGSDFDDDFKYVTTEAIKKQPITTDRSMMYIYDQVQKLKFKKLRQTKREYETTKIPASPETSATNWKRLEGAYDSLPNLKNQGKFYVSKKDKTNFNALSEFRQENVIKSVEAMKNNSTTASKPSIYIEKAMADNLKKVEQHNSNQLIGM